MDYRRAFPKEYLTAHWLSGKDLPLTIAKCDVEQLQIPGQSDQESKLVIDFQELIGREGKPHKLALNVTNAQTIAEVLKSNETGDWVGKSITIYPTTTKFGRETVECIRVRRAAPITKPKTGKGE